MKYLSLFSGIGGFELGIARATKDTWDCVGYSEIDKYAVQTYEKNFGTEVKNYGDITTTRTEDLPDFDMLCGGFPCQAFSIAGKRRGFEDTRGTLFFDIARILRAKRPKIVFLENVKGLLNHQKGETFKVILQTLDELGYDVQWMVLNSKFFGVPQNRERVFIIGHLRDKCRRKVLSFRNNDQYNVEEDKGESSLPTTTSRTVTTKFGGRFQDTFVRTIKAGYYKISPDQTYVYCVDDGASPKYQNKMIETSPALKATRSNYEVGTIKIPTNTKKGYDVAKERTDGIRLQYGSSKTARGRVVKGASQALQAGSTPGVLDTQKIRKLTPIECERLQGFPDNWTEGVSDTQRYKQCGNAVTVNVIEAITKQLRGEEK